MTGIEPATPQSYLDLYLQPLVPWLEREDVTDIFVNRPGELWAETLGGAVERAEVPELDEPLLWRLARQIASASHQGISRQHPLLAGTLPGGARVQICAPPATRGAMALAIRKHLSVNLGLEDHVAQGAFEHLQVGGTERDDLDGALRNRLDDGDVAGFLRAAVKARRTIIVAGGTSSGKTTLVNSLLCEAPAHERLVLIEDTPELQMTHANGVGLVAVKGELGEASVDAEDLLQASLRMRPDRIILGELRGREAYQFLRAIRSGHPGSITTVHADSPRKAIEQIALMVLQGGVSLRSEEVMGFVESAVDIFVQMTRENGRRRVSQITFARDFSRL